MTSVARERRRGARGIAAADRVVVKVGSSSLTTAAGRDRRRTGSPSWPTRWPRGSAAGSQVVLVSSGAIAAGLAPLGLPRRPRDLATQQAAASVGQGLLVATYTAAFARHGVRTGQVLLTADDLIRRAHYRNAQRTLGRLLELGVLPIVNENDTVATDEIRFGDNDRLAALVAHLVRADALILLSDVDGLYDSDPRRPGARRIAEVRSRADLAGVTLGRPRQRGTRRHRRDGHQGRRGHDRHRGGHPDRGGRGRGGRRPRSPGSRSAPTSRPPGRRPGARQLWLAHAAVGRGRLLLDAGAVRGRPSGRASLLPAGITGVEGGFDAGDPVDLCDPRARSSPAGWSTTTRPRSRR